MSSELKKMFKQNGRKLPDEVVRCLEIAEDYAISKGHRSIQKTHIVYGYMCLLESKLANSNTTEFPILTSCFISPNCYSEMVRLSVLRYHDCKDQTRISTDLAKFIALYNLFSMSYKFDLETFYLLLFYHSNCLGKSDSSSYIPHGNIVFDENESFIDFLKHNACNRGFINMKELIKADQLNANYSVPIKVPYMTDLTHQMYIGELSTIFVGRDNELHQLVNILCKKNKNNPVLIGEPGVGKTTLVYALAKRLVTNQIGIKLQNYHILELDITSSIAGAKYRGDFEERINNSLNNLVELTNSGKKIIMYIDEIHTIVSVGGAEGAIDLSAMLKPFLLNPSVKIIGTSTLKDFRTIESDKALERRFDSIMVNEPSFDETVTILTALKPSLEAFHGLTIADSTIGSVISLSKRYIPERFLPDKAIDLLDETCAIKANSGTKSKVLPDDAFLAISIKKRIPIHKVQDSYDLLNLESALNSRVIGQKHVSASLATAVRRTKAGLNDESRPLASFMFVGPTGVGKTEAAKALADLVFSGKDNIIRLDMSEYMEEYSVSKLIGSSPGYVGYEEAGLLTERVRRNPYSLVLFDEFEKAHPKICNILLQILDEGSLTDSKGEHINFKNTIVILTSNVGASTLSKETFGFSDCSNSKSRSILSEVKKTFSPEFLNRLDEIIQFNYLSEEDIYEIAKLHIADLIKKVNALNIRIDISDEVISRIAQLGYSHEYGARELRRTIDKEIKNPLSDLILQKDVDSVSVRISDGQIKVLQNVTISV